MQHSLANLVVIAGTIWCSMPVALAKDEPNVTNSASTIEKTFLLRGVVVDSKTETPLPCRVYIKSTKGAWYFPKSSSPQGSAVEYQRQVGPNSLEQHVTISAHPFEIELPSGTYTVMVERGKEYVPLSREVVIEQQPLDVTFPLRRWIDMAKAGWFSGDVHAHRPLSEVPNLVLAEDLNVAMPLSHWVTAADTGPVTGNRITAPLPTAEWIPVDATHGIYPLNTEYEIFSVAGKPHTLGAVLILGQKSTIDQGIPPVRRVAERAHQEGAFLDLEKHSWAWTPMIVPLMKPDLFELANNHCWPSEFAFHSWTFEMAAKSMQLQTVPGGFSEWGWIEFGFKSYYAYLNCGFRMMPSAGTGSGVHPVPLGFSRVYARISGEFSYEKWRESLLAGRSFVTTGPMMQLEFNGQTSGSTLRGNPTGTTVRVAGFVSSWMPLDRVEILVNGMVAKTIKRSEIPSSKETETVTKIDEPITVHGSGWIAVRAFEFNPNHRIRFAHTAPVFVDVPGQRQAPYKDEVEHFVERMEREVGRHRGVLSPDAIDEYQEALTIYRDLEKRAIERPASIHPE